MRDHQDIRPQEETQSAETDADRHPYADLDRMSRAVLARNTGGVSPFSIYQAWNDWALHMSRAPGRQLELGERAVTNAFKVMADTARNAFEPTDPPPFKPMAYDHRFTHAGWAKMPFRFWQQSFLATQDWWNHATEELRGLSEADSD